VVDVDETEALERLPTFSAAIEFRGTRLPSLQGIVEIDLNLLD